LGGDHRERDRPGRKRQVGKWKEERKEGNGEAKEERERDEVHYTGTSFFPLASSPDRYTAIALTQACK